METNKILSFQEQNQLEHDSIRKEAEKKAKELFAGFHEYMKDKTLTIINYDQYSKSWKTKTGSYKESNISKMFEALSGYIGLSSSGFQKLTSHSHIKEVSRQEYVGLGEYPDKEEFYQAIKRDIEREFYNERNAKKDLEMKKEKYKIFIKEKKINQVWLLTISDQPGDNFERHYFSLLTERMSVEEFTGEVLTNSETPEIQEIIRDASTQELFDLTKVVPFEEYKDHFEKYNNNEERIIEGEERWTD